LMLDSEESRITKSPGAAVAGPVILRASAADAAVPNRPIPTNRMANLRKYIDKMLLLGKCKSDARILPTFRASRMHPSNNRYGIAFEKMMHGFSSRIVHQFFISGKVTF
jgi:hypothetical protein